MPISQFEMQQALRVRLGTLAVSSLSGVDLAVSFVNPFWTYTRTVGSFTDDGFYPGMEIDAAGFSDSLNNGLSVVKAAEDLILTVDKTLVTEAAAGGRTLDVGLPSRVAWENIEFKPDLEQPYIEEELLPGVAEQITLGPGGLIELEPIYIVTLFLAPDSGSEAMNLYGDALVDLFAPRVAMSLANGDVLRVRSTPSSSRGQLIQLKPGWATVPVRIPLRIRTINP